MKQHGKALNIPYSSFSVSDTLGDEILYGVVRKKFLELAVELCSQSLVVGDDKRRFIQLLDDIRHRESLS